MNVLENWLQQKYLGEQMEQMEEVERVEVVNGINGLKEPEGPESKERPGRSESPESGELQEIKTAQIQESRNSRYFINPFCTGRQEHNRPRASRRGNKYLILIKGVDLDGQKSRITEDGFSRYNPK